MVAIFVAFADISSLELISGFSLSTYFLGVAYSQSLLEGKSMIALSLYRNL